MGMYVDEIGEKPREWLLGIELKGGAIIEYGVSVSPQ